MVFLAFSVIKEIISVEVDIGRDIKMTSSQVVCQTLSSPLPNIIDAESDLLSP